MVIEAIPSPGAEAVGQPADELSRLSDILLARGALDNRTLDRARRVAADTGGRLDRVLTQLGMVSERDLAEALAELVGSVLISPADYPEAPLFVDRLKPKFLHKARALPIADTPDNVILAMADPLDGFVSGSIAAALGRPVAIAVAVPIEFEAAFNRLYPESESGQGGAHSGDIVSDAEPSEEDTERLKDLASEAPVIRLVNQLIARAVETGASDVHIEPFEDRLRIRYRYDGALHEAEPPPARLRAAVISRVKIMSRLDIAERRLPQDGRIRLSVRGQEVDFRVSTIPSLNGESVVLRVLDRTAVEFDFVKLGLPDDVRQALGTGGGLRCGFQDHRVAGRQCRGGFPTGDREGEVPGGDETGDAVRAAAGEQQTGVGGRLVDGAGGLVRGLGVVPPDRDGARYFGAGFGAMLLAVVEHLPIANAEAESPSR